MLASSWYQSTLWLWPFSKVIINKCNQQLSTSIMSALLLLKRIPHFYGVEHISCTSNLTGSQFKSNQYVMVIFNLICVHVTLCLTYINIVLSYLNHEEWYPSFHCHYASYLLLQNLHILIIYYASEFISEMSHCCVPILRSDSYAKTWMKELTFFPCLTWRKFGLLISQSVCLNPYQSDHPFCHGQIMSSNVGMMVATWQVSRIRSYLLCSLHVGIF